MTTARSAVAPAGSFGNYHCVSRCVRRAWLCGFDKLTGKSYEHRRSWLVDRMNQLGSIFAVRVLAYCAMSNHLHLALQFDPAWVESWSDQACAERWTALYGGPADETDEQRQQRVANLLRKADKMEQIRVRLCSVSEFMKCLNEHIARMANIEDEVTGRFWEGRFKCQRLLDEQALLSVMAYIDLNPVRAGMAEDLESSDYTSIQQRIRETARRLDDIDKLIEPVAGVPGPLRCLST
ncbi:MAG: transposase [Lysobacterales bacterium]